MIRIINDLAKQSQIILPGINEGEILTGSSEPEKKLLIFTLSRALSQRL